MTEAESDYLIARFLFPTNHQLYTNGMAAQIHRGASIFDPGEAGHPTTLAQHVEDTYNWGQAKRYEPSPHGELTFPPGGGPPVRLVRVPQPPVDLWNPVIATLNPLPTNMPVSQPIRVRRKP